MIVGTAGHIDHGKTSLVRALTGIDTDRLKEEKARGITIELGFAYLPAPHGGSIGFVDVPGHERFVHTMLAGAGGIDLALLVVAADDGLMPQTLEHLAILDLLGIRRGIVALTKSDLADPERRAAITVEIENALAPTGLAGSDVLPVSTVTGEGIAALRDRLFAESEGASGRVGQADGGFRLAVDRCFTLTGAGTVVTGTVLSGEVAVGDRVVVAPHGLAARVRSLHAQNRRADRGRTGERCALNLAGEGVSTESIGRGDVVLDPALHAPSDRIDAELRLLTGAARPVDTWFPVRLHHGATEVGARIVPLGADSVAPGETGPVQFVLERPIAAASGDRFVIRDTSAQATLGGGRFLDLRAPSRKRRTPERLRALAALGRDNPADAVANLLEVPPGTLDLGGFARDRALAPEAAGRIEERLGLRRLDAGRAGAVVLLPETWDALRTGLEASLAAFHADNPDLQGIGLERLRTGARPRLSAPLFRAALGLLAAEGVLSLAGSFVRLSGHEVRLDDEEEALWRRAGPLLAAAERFRPPRVRDLAERLDADEAEVRRVLKLVGRRGEIDEVAHDHFFLRGTVAEMSGIVRDVSVAAPDGFFTAAQFRDRVQNGRKVAIQILDFFDRHGVTLRRGDLRRANRHRLDLFGLPGLGTEPEGTRLR